MATLHVNYLLVTHFTDLSHPREPKSSCTPPTFSLPPLVDFQIRLFWRHLGFCGPQCLARKILQFSDVTISSDTVQTLTRHNNHVVFVGCPFFEYLQTQTGVQHTGRGKNNHRPWIIDKLSIERLDVFEIKHVPVNATRHTLKPKKNDIF